MRPSANGQISYGIAFGDGFKFPWDAEDEEECGDIYDWWLAVNEVADEWEARNRWIDEHPCPVELVNCRSCDYPMYALVVPSSVRTANRGGPEAFDPAALTVTEEERAALLEFCEKYGIQQEGEPAWLLTSYWG